MDTAVLPHEDLIAATAQRLYEAECALHDAHRTGVDAWIAAAGDRLHDAVIEHRVALSGRLEPPEPAVPAQRCRSRRNWRFFSASELH